MSFFQKTKGSISIFLVLIMLPMFTMAGLLVDGARISAARVSISGAGDLTMNAALSEYDDVIKDVYGLFAMSDSVEELEENVSRYFHNTINNTGILEGSDSYTRSFINSISSMFSTDEIEFDNIIDTEVESFSLVEVASSTIANPLILERQIVDYMKYRGPVNLANGLLTKLGCIGETSKQTKVVERKIDYEKDLDNVQQACQTAYNAINAYNGIIRSSNYNANDYLGDIEHDIGLSYQSNTYMVQYIIAANSPGFKISLASDDSVRQPIEEALINIPEESKNTHALSMIKDGLSSYVTLNSDGDDNYTIRLDFLQNIEIPDEDDDLDEQIAYVIEIKQKVEALNRITAYLSLYNNYFDRLTDEQKEAFENEKDAYMQITARSNSYINAANEFPDIWKNKANVLGRLASNCLYDNWYADMGDIEETLEDAIKALESVIDKVRNLDNSRVKWGNSIDDLSANDIKTSMKGDYDNAAKDLNEDAINSLIEALKDNKSHFKQIKDRLDGIEFYEHKVCFSGYISTNFYDRFSSKIGEPNVDTMSRVTTEALNVIGSNYENKSVSALSPAPSKIVGETHQFYKYLVNMFKSLEEDDSESKEESKELRKNLIKAGNDEASTEVDIGDITTGLVSDVVSEDISEMILDLIAGREVSSDTFSPDEVDSNGSNSKVADQNKKNLSAISKLLDGLANIATSARDNVFIEEYITEMFSCLTSGFDSTGNPIENPTSLNMQDLSQNRFYRSEIEYILWGNDNVTVNLNNTKALIFGIRFALNTVYAFTASDIRSTALTAATAIAGWTGFGVPIVQTIIILAWSMAESVVDVTTLSAGKSVAIFKSRDTWFLGSGGLKNAIEDGVKKVSERLIDDVFEKISNLAADGIDQAIGSIEDYIADTSRNLVVTVTGVITSPIEQLALSVIGNSSLDWTRDDVEQKVEECLQSLKNSIDEEGDSAVKGAKLEAINIVTITFKNRIVDAIYSCCQKAKDTSDSIVQEINTTVQGLINDILVEITTPINDKISEAGDWLTDQAKGYIDEGSDIVKEKLTGAIDDYTKKLSGSIPTGGVSDAKNLSAATGLTMSYKEYLKAFVLMNTMINSKKTAMLARTAELIHANVRQRKGTFDISKSYTIVQVNATVSIRTTFFNVPLALGVDPEGKTTYDLDFGNIGSDRQKIKYVGILGY